MSSELGYTSLFGEVRSSPPLSPSQTDICNSNNDVDQASLAFGVDCIDQLDDEEQQSEQESEVNSYSSDSRPGPIRLDSNVNRWRYLTHNERALAGSLDRLEDDDLAIHLYNTHSLKRRLYTLDSDSRFRQSSSQERPRKRTIESWHCKERWIMPHDEQGNQTWYPSKAWSTWPLEPDIVPRARERQIKEWYEAEDEEGWTTRKKDDGQWKPSQELEDILLAELTKLARERFEEREWENLQNNERSAIDRTRGVRKVRSRSSKATIGAKKRGALSDGVQSHRTSSRSRGQTAGSRSTSPKRSVRRPASKNDGFRSDGNWSRSGADTSADEKITANVRLKPVAIADDEKALRLLEVPIRHILHKLDNLLMSLHYSRQNHLTTRGSESETDTQTSWEFPVAETRRRGRADTKSRRTSRSTSTPSRNVSANRIRRNLERLRARDWSEVLGIATITGWNDQVVKRAANRCSQLFWEKMYFRNIGNDNRRDHEMDEDRAQSNSETSGIKLRGGIHEDGFMRPITLG